MSVDIAALVSAFTTPERVKEVLGSRFQVFREKVTAGSARVCVSLARAVKVGSPIDAAFNGIVFEYPGWKVLAMPAPVAYAATKGQVLGALAASRQVSAMIDGTCVCLYHYGGCWRISTRNAYDVSNLTFIGKYTYSDALHECLTAVDGFSYDSLDIGCSYSLCFRHPEFHPLAKKPEVYLTRCVDLTTHADKLFLGIPAQPTAHLPRMNGEGLYKWMCAKNDNSLAKYLDRRTTFHEEHHGFVIAGPAGNLLLESRLYATVRGIMYNIPKDQRTAEERVTRALVAAYLGPKCWDCLNLFPQYKHVYTKFSTAVEWAAGKIYDCVQDKKTRDLMERSNRSTDMYLYGTYKKLADEHKLVITEKYTKSIIEHYLRCRPVDEIIELMKD